MSRDDKPTPPPRNPSESQSMIALIYDQTKAMREVDLPRIESVATEAKNASIELQSRVNTLESNPHECDEKDRQLKQDEDIADQGNKINFIYMLKNIVLWIVLFVCGGALTFAGTSIASDATQKAKIQSNRDDINRHEGIIPELVRKSDLKQLQKSINNVPSAVKNKIEEDGGPPTVAEVSEAAEDLPLKAYELKQLRIILGRAKKREVSDRNDIVKTSIPTLNARK